ncbi:hypothetical protein BAUCODRAFT_277741 [Baudoinia panamericana UAMH 10762]|uniref:Uncharacterized protein n=1 Tax=Baudoinia panamericana (strain UAMH 10762) TaxID=717646 RepID=M2LDT5_BAUPA|nr:uncharacterized protein BAUCODRAFT_277741 [Baudoinia panamericana UAMH 10762]EMC92142.1 hypothetical protein BAUCODRAFT_277741 [Baudoinia panamericana UAMH 10762]
MSQACQSMRFSTREWPLTQCRCVLSPRKSRGRAQQRRHRSFRSLSTSRPMSVLPEPQTDTSGWQWNMLVQRDSLWLPRCLPVRCAKLQDDGGDGGDVEGWRWKWGGARAF